jgi:hypothetical protein
MDRLDRETLRAQVFGDEFAELSIIIDYQDTFHKVSLRASSSPSSGEVSLFYQTFWDMRVLLRQASRK